MFGLRFIDLITIIAFIIFLVWFLLKDFSPPTTGLLLEKSLKLYEICC